MRKTKLLVAMAMILLVACATTKPFNEWTPKEKANWFMGMYNAEYNDYKIQAANPNLTDPQREALRIKKQILTQVYPMLGTYTSLVSNNGVPPPELELQLMQLLNQLATKATK